MKPSWLLYAAVALVVYAAMKGNGAGAAEAGGLLLPFPTNEAVDPYGAYSVPVDSFQATRPPLEGYWNTVTGG